MRTHELEGRKREEWVGELGNMARHKQGLTNWRGGRGRSGFVSLETWPVPNEASLTGGWEEDAPDCEPAKQLPYQPGLTNLKGGRGKRRNPVSGTLHFTN